MQDARWGLTRMEEMGRIPSLALLATLLLMQPRTQLAFWAMSAHWWLMSSFSFLSTPKSLSAGLLSILPVYQYIGGCPDHVQDPAAPGLVEPHEVHKGLLLKLVQVQIHSPCSCSTCWSASISMGIRK